MSDYKHFFEHIKNFDGVAVKGTTLGEQCFLLSKTDKKCVAIAPNAEYAFKMYEQLTALGKKVALLDNFDKLFLSSRFQSRQNYNKLLKTLFEIAKNKIDIVVTTADCLFLNLADKTNFLKNCILLKQKKQYNYAKLIEKLKSIGYSRVQTVEQAGEFAVRGDIVDIFAVNYAEPVRVSFFGDETEAIYYFNLFNNSKIKDLQNFEISPYSLLTKNDDIKNLLQTFNSLATRYKENQLYGIVSQLESGNFENYEFLQIAKKNHSIFDFCSDFCFAIVNTLSVENAFNAETQSIKKRIDILFSDAQLADNYKQFYSLPMEKLFKNRQKIIFDSTQNFIKYNPDKVLTLNCVKFDNFLYKTELLAAQTKQYADKKSIVLCLDNFNTLNAIKNIFTKMRIKFSETENSKGLVLSDKQMPYNICFEDEEVFYIGTTNFAHKKKVAVKHLGEAVFLPKANEYVVHNIHGIGLCEGVVTIESSGVEKDFFKIKYKNNEYLYVPVENTNSLSLYASDSKAVTLNKLGGKEFLATLQRAQKAIDDMAAELVQLYSARAALKGYKYPPDDYLYTEFEQAFAYQETPDQLQAISDVKKDMCSDKIMDRLICGDVGYGKTEVAIRAMFKAVLENRQVAMLAPTTILSLQHYLTVIDRLKNFDVNTEMLNRFKTKKEQEKILQNLKLGKTNIVCGTHRLLSKDVQFANLGLLILDEEQRFGVRAKEKIKQLKRDVDVLALSATPIPRTLNMALLALRDISIINTPPKDRLAVKTYVMIYNIDIISQAIKDEVVRGGQVLVVLNDIDKIYTLAYNLKKAVNDENIIFDVAHGQMPEVALENAIKRLYDRKTQVLVSTTLIENGIDLPKANTLIVLNSHKLGLSQMYQLRGRVGRSNEQAFAYFTYPREAQLTTEAANRLETIAENSELGSGFKIAMRDLQIRGAGELLGRQQHGHIIKIGYDMYVKLLSQATKNLSGEKYIAQKEIKIDIDISSKISSAFIEQEAQRIKVYAQINNITDEKSQKEVLENLKSTYGKLPDEIIQLSNVALIKWLAVKQNVKEIKISKQEMYINYYKQDLNLDILLKKVQKFNKFVLKNAQMPTIFLDIKAFSPLTAQTYIINYLKYQNF